MKKHLQSLEIITNVNVTCASLQKSHVKNIGKNEVPISRNGNWHYFYFVDGMTDHSDGSGIMIA
ncbi:hypothetical protein [Bacillus pinisoli]|uniref:hypothetical protein n=1 Tax=Bacillus pinisoli TaxID=2901866 RepID=UPI001FF14755|nr:hypothetical protein [Bacillus pinisoli]